MIPPFYPVIFLYWVFVDSFNSKYYDADMTILDMELPLERLAFFCII